MAGQFLMINGSPCHISFPDGYGEAIVNGRKWAWDFSEYGGPLFLKKDGEPRKSQCPTNKKVWAAFYQWLSEYYIEKGKTERAEGVKKILEEKYESKEMNLPTTL